MAGYSKSLLVDKLGLKAGFKVAFINPPRDYLASLGKLPKDVSVAGDSECLVDFIHCFSRRRRDVEGQFAGLKPRLAPNGMLWFSWPKGSSGIETDLNENVLREIGLRNGLVDVKVCAVDDVWSGLKFVFRLKDRPKHPKPSRGNKSK